MNTLLRSTLLLGALLATSVRADVAIVLNSNDDDMSIIDTTTYKEIKRVPIGKGPHHLIPTPDDRLIVVGNTQSNDLVYLDPKTGDVVRRLPRIPDPYHLGFSPDQRWLVITGNRLDRVDLYRHDAGNLTLAAQLPLAKVPSHMAFSADSKTVYVTLQESDQVAAIDLATQTTRWVAPTSGRQPAGVWVTPDGKHLLVGLTGADYVDVLAVADGRALKRIATGMGAHAFLPKGDGRHVYLSNRVANTVSVIDQTTLAVVDRIDVPGGPDCMELRKDGTELWVTSRWINRVSVIDLTTKKLKHSIRVGRSPHGLYFHTHAPRT
jgi:YVTN family beta-propeller protein